LASLTIAVVIGLATVLIPNPIFARDIPPVWWNYPVWILTSIFAGMLTVTYLKRPTEQSPEPLTKHDKRTDRWGLSGTLLTWVAVGCPVCNQSALLAFGSAGLITWFAPIQPLLAVGALLLTGIALMWRLRGQILCVIPTPKRQQVTTP